VSAGVVIFAKYDASQSGTPIWAISTGPTDFNNAYAGVFGMAVAPGNKQLYITGV
jgi:hypothetical protein